MTKTICLFCSVHHLQKTLVGSVRALQIRKQRLYLFDYTRQGMQMQEPKKLIPGFPEVTIHGFQTLNF